jgi:hypothetical protein
VLPEHADQHEAAIEETIRRAARRRRARSTLGHPTIDRVRDVAGLDD